MKMNHRRWERAKDREGWWCCCLEQFQFGSIYPAMIMINHGADFMKNKNKGTKKTFRFARRFSGRCRHALRMKGINPYGSASPFQLALPFLERITKTIC